MATIWIRAVTGGKGEEGEKKWNMGWFYNKVLGRFRWYSAAKNMTFNKCIAEQSKCRTNAKQPFVNKAAHQ